MTGVGTIHVERYTQERRAVWDEFVARSKNGVFLFQRGYMEYHADRFADHSLLFRHEDRLVAVLPANLRDGVLVSHGGLTFGGIVSDDRMRTAVMLDIFAALRTYLRTEHIPRLVYKAVPHIYHRAPAEEDLYALFVHGARLVRRDVSSTIRTGDRLPLTKGRKCGAKKARNEGVEATASDDFAAFMRIEEEQLLKRYGVRPTHTADELHLLAGRFPENIRLFVARRKGDLLGGVVVYANSRVAHAQYIATTEEGKRLAALDALVEHLLDEVYPHVPHFDFGISTEKNGRYLNVGLIENKESFGARAIAYDFYELDADP